MNSVFVMFTMLRGGGGRNREGENVSFAHLIGRKITVKTTNALKS